MFINEKQPGLPEGYFIRYRKHRKICGSLSSDEFCEDDKTSSAVIRKFEIIGEAVKKTGDDAGKSNPYIPWKEMAGMRGRLIHAYSDVDYDLIWHTIKNRLPEVKKQVQKMLENR